MKEQALVVFCARLLLEGGDFTGVRVNVRTLELLAS